jgi:hypothetical protein
MTSVGIEGSGKAAIRLSVLLVIFLLVGVTLHLAYAAIVLGIGIPVVMLRGFGKWPLAAITGAVVALFATVVLDNLIHLIWPTPFVTGWDIPWGIDLPWLWF